jgi:hypothetical protein
MTTALGSFRTPMRLRTFGHWLEDATYTVLIGSAVLAAIGLLGYQVVTWLRTAEWVSFPVQLAWDWAMAGSAHDRWLRDPHAWIGLHKVVVGILRVPLPAGLFVLAWLFSLAWQSDSQSRPRS